MTMRRWMKSILEEAKNEQIDMPWSRTIRAEARTAKTAPSKAAG
jgi:alkylated DNA nucleotide flippase Atl1